MLLIGVAIQVTKHLWHKGDAPRDCFFNHFYQQALQFIRPEHLEIAPEFANDAALLLAQKELAKINMFKVRCVCAFVCICVCAYVCVFVSAFGHGSEPALFMIYQWTLTRIWRVCECVCACVCVLMIVICRGQACSGTDPPGCTVSFLAIFSLHVVNQLIQRNQFVSSLVN